MELWQGRWAVPMGRQQGIQQIVPEGEAAMGRVAREPWCASSAVSSLCCSSAAPEHCSAATVGLLFPTPSASPALQLRVPAQPRTQLSQVTLPSARSHRLQGEQEAR